MKRCLQRHEVTLLGYHILVPESDDLEELWEHFEKYLGLGKPGLPGLLRPLLCCTIVWVRLGFGSQNPIYNKIGFGVGL